jgi:PAS domain S-box-containing protein
MSDGATQLWNSRIRIQQSDSTEPLLRRRDRRTLRFLDQLPLGVFVIDAQGAYVYSNKAATLLLGYQPKTDYTGDRLREAFRVCVAGTDEPYEVQRNPIFRALAGDFSYDDNVEVVRPDGTRIHLEAWGSPIVDEAGRVIYATSVFNDITGRKGVEDGALSARLEAERSNAAKNAFLSHMSHELRTPLNAILGFGQLLEMDELSAEQRDSVRHIVTSGEHLLGLIDEVLDISQMEEGALRLTLEPVCVSDVVAEAVGMLGPLAQQRGVGIIAEVIDPKLHLLADRQRFKQVMVNLLANAVKYNRQDGSVSIKSRLSAAGRLRVTVVDTGIGIAKKDLDRLFQPFDRISPEDSLIEGTGLGLALTKQLMTAMAGKVGVSSRIGKGSSFWVELPTTEAPLQSEGEALPNSGIAKIAPLPGRRTVLYVEDNLSNVRLLERVIARRPDITLMVAMQGEVALHMAAEVHPDLILLDLHLTDISGEQVLRILREDPRTADIPVVVTTADATSGLPEQLLSKGATHYLTKPFDIPRLMAVIDYLGAPRHDMPRGLAAKRVLESTTISTDQNLDLDTALHAETLLEIAHDLNNELGVISGYTSLIADDTTNPTTAADLITISGAIQRAAQLTMRLNALANPMDDNT